MIPFSAVGTILMGYVWLSTRGRDVKGSQGEESTKLALRGGAKSDMLRLT